VTVSYATFDDLDLGLSKPETNERIINRIESALVGTTERLTQELGGMDFFRHPADPDADDEVRLFNTNGGSTIHVHTGIVSVSLIRIRDSRWSDWVEFDPTDFDLEAWASADQAQATATTEPFDHIRLNGTGFYFYWPRGQRLVEITGVFGWPAVPQRVIDANVDWARQAIAADRTYPGGVQSPDEAGIPQLFPRLPDSVYRLKLWSLARYSCAT
jgi:hypothetical protein